VEAIVSTLASGSAGNSLYVAVGETRVLVDIGIAMRKLERDLAALDTRADSLSAVLVTHEHADHVRGLAAFRDRHPHVPVLASAGTCDALTRQGLLEVCRPALRSGTDTAIGSLRVSAFSVSHDAREPFGFRIHADGFALCVITDLGVAAAHVAQAALGCRVLVVEANHDEDMLWSGRYPQHLKRRIASPRGHLSNRQAAALVAAAASNRLQHVVLAHLSEENNDAQRAVDEVAPVLRAQRGATLTVAPGRRAGEPLRFTLDAVSFHVEPGADGPTQLTLFD